MTPQPATLIHFISDMTDSSPCSLLVACIPRWIAKHNSPSGGQQKLLFSCFPSHYVPHKISGHETELRNKEARKRWTNKSTTLILTVIKAFISLQIDSKARLKLCFLNPFHYFSQPSLFRSLDNSRHLQQSNQPRYKAYIWNEAQGKICREN